MTRSISMIALLSLSLSACGDGVVGADYPGEVLAELTGVVEDPDGLATEPLEVHISWINAGGFSSELADVEGEFPAAFTLRLYQPPPAPTPPGENVQITGPEGITVGFLVAGTAEYFARQASFTPGQPVDVVPGEVDVVGFGRQVILYVDESADLDVELPDSADPLQRGFNVIVPDQETIDCRNLSGNAWNECAFDADLDECQGPFTAPDGSYDDAAHDACRVEACGDYDGFLLEQCGEIENRIVGLDTELQILLTQQPKTVAP